jgi:hypothetical protein
MKDLEILRVVVEPIARDVIGRTSGLSGHALVKTNTRVTMQFDLSPETIDTIQECVTKDFEAELKRIKA